MCSHYYGCALQVAARYYHVEGVRLLLDADAQVSIIEGKYHNALQAGIAGGHERIVRELILRGANVNLMLKKSFKKKNTGKQLPSTISSNSNPNKS